MSSSAPSGADSSREAFKGTGGRGRRPRLNETTPASGGMQQGGTGIEGFDGPCPGAPHFSQARKSSRVERGYDRDDVLSVNRVLQPQRRRTKMQLNHSQQPNRVSLDNQLRDPAFQTPFHRGAQQHIGDRTNGAAVYAAASRDAETCPFPNVGTDWPFDLAKLRHDFRKEMRTS